MCRVLVLDDDAYFCQRTARLLEEADGEHPYHVDAFEDAEPAIIAAQKAVKAGSPYEIFVIDQRLKSGLDGIEVLRDLKTISPDSDGIILTLYGREEADGARAYEAGAFRYLTKTADRELNFVLQSLRYHRQVQSENEWQKTHIRMSEDGLRCDNFHEAAQVVVENALGLGYENAYLFWVPHAENADDPESLIGVAQAGPDPFWNGEVKIFAIRQLKPFDMDLQKSEASLYRFGQKGTELENQGWVTFPRASLDWAIMPLKSAQSLQGMLLATRQSGQRIQREYDCAQLTVFAQQAAAVLERASLFEREKRSLEETETINKIGRHINARAAKDDLTTLLDQVRADIASLMNVDNFIVFLADTNNHQLDFRLQYLRGVKQSRKVYPIERGMAGYLLKQSETLFLPSDVRTYREARGIPLFGPQAQTWLGAPLLVDEQAIGGLIILDYDRPYAYTQRDKRLLTSIADQIAGAIKISHLAEAQRGETKRLHILQRASIEMMRIANKNEDHFWLLLLTLATANFGARFNRALLFLTQNGSRRLYGRMGIGTADDAEARRDWRADEKRGFNFDLFLEEINAGRVRSTPFQKLVQQVEIDLETDGGVFSEVIASQTRQWIPAEQAATRLPVAFNLLFTFGECVVLPLIAGRQALGVLIVDNKHDGKDIQEEMLESLQTVMNSAGLVWENLQQGRQRDFLLDAHHSIMGKSGAVPLAHTLKQICDAARAISGADWATILPLKQDSEFYEVDNPNITTAGNLAISTHLATQDKPRHKGASTFILNHGALIAGDITRPESEAGWEFLVNHPFLKREYIRAVIGLPIQDEITSKNLGVFYLNHRSPRDFSPAEIEQAYAFAGMAAAAISNHWRILAAQQDAEAMSQREREITRQILQAALEQDTEQKVIETLVAKIDQAMSFFGVRTAIILRAWEARSIHAEPRPAYKTYIVDGGMVVERDLPEIQRRDIYGAMRSRSVRRNRSQQVFIPVEMNEQTGGLLYADSPQGALLPEHVEILNRFAPVAALALDNIHRHEHLHEVLQVAQKVTEPTHLKTTFRAMLESARKVTPELSALSIWYLKDDQRPAPGETFGLRKNSRKTLDETDLEPRSVVESVMQANRPLFAERIKAHPDIFVPFRRVVSGAAFPLRADNEIVGAMFFYYRRRHIFSPEERMLFTLLAEFVAASIRDAKRLEDEREERERLATVLRIGETIGAEIELKHVFVRILEDLRQNFANTALSVLVYDKDERALRFVPETLDFYPIDNPDFSTRHTFPVDGLSIACQVARRALNGETNSYQLVETVQEDPNYLPLVSKSSAELCVSLGSGENLRGVLVLERQAPNTFDDRDIKLIQGVAQQIALAIQRAEQSSDLKFKSNVAATYAWTADIAHDINREMGHIKSWAYLIQEYAGQPEKTNKYAQLIESSVQQLTSLNPQRVDTEWTLIDEEVKRHVSEFARARNIETYFELHCDGLKIKLNRFAFRRVWRHLVRNAAQAMTDCITKHLLVQTRRVDEFVEIRITDNGPGVSEAAAPFIFQVPVTTKEEGGYGLLMVRQMIEDMNGRISWLRFQQEQGATFSIRLPIQSIEKEPLKNMMAPDTENQAEEK